MLNTKVDELLQDEHRSYTGVKASESGEEILIESELVIGADGRYSTVRKKADLDVTIRKHGYDLLWARIPAPVNWEPSIRMTLIGGSKFPYLHRQRVIYKLVGISKRVLLQHSENSLLLHLSSNS